MSDFKAKMHQITPDPLAGFKGGGLFLTEGGKECKGNGEENLPPLKFKSGYATVHNKLHQHLVCWRWLTRLQAQMSSDARLLQWKTHLWNCSQMLYNYVSVRRTIAHINKYILCTLTTLWHCSRYYKILLLFEFDDVRILDTSGVFNCHRIVWGFFVECEQSKKIFHLSLRMATGAHVRQVRSWFSAACDISTCHNLQIRRLDQWFSALQVLISNSCTGNFNMPEN